MPANLGCLALDKKNAMSIAECAGWKRYMPCPALHTSLVADTWRGIEAVSAYRGMGYRVLSTTPFSNKSQSKRPRKHDDSRQQRHFLLSFLCSATRYRYLISVVATKYLVIPRQHHHLRGRLDTFRCAKYLGTQKRHKVSSKQKNNHGRIRSEKSLTPAPSPAFTNVIILLRYLAGWLAWLITCFRQSLRSNPSLRCAIFVRSASPFSL